MPSFQLVDKLLETPLFQGISKADLHEIVGTTKFGFSKYEEGRLIVKADAMCKELLFLLNGTIKMTTLAADHSYTVTEFLTAPQQLQPQRLFGIGQHYTSTFHAHTPCNFMTLSKNEVVKLYSNYEVFRINLLNIFATGVQRHENQLWMPQSMTLRNRILRFFTIHTKHPAGEKLFKIKMETLAAELNDSRLDISIELNKLQADGLVVLSRGLIRIPSMEQLYK